MGNRTTSRPKLITPVGGSYLLPRPEPVVVPTDLPPQFPAPLRLKTSILLAEVVKEFPDRSKLESLCCEIAARMTNLLCTAVREGVIKDYAAPDHLNDLLHYVRVENCDDSNERFRIERAVKNSDEWTTFLKQLVACEKVAKDSAYTRPANWGEIEIRFTSDHRVQIICGNSREAYNYGDLGFSDSRDGKPRAAWATLLKLAKNEGKLDYSEIPAKEQSAVEKRIQEIRTALRKKFGMMTDPISYEQGSGYRTAFKIRVMPSIDT